MIDVGKQLANTHGVDTLSQVDVSSSLRARSAAARLGAELDTSRTRPSWSPYLARAWIAPLERVTKPVRPNVPSGRGGRPTGVSTQRF